MYEASDTMEGSPKYSKGDIVWVKLSSYWWPGEVINIEDLPGDLLSDFKKPPLVFVKFFDEDSYEYVRNWLNIHPYNCQQKTEFIKKGMAGFRSKLSHMAKFPKDIGTAEERTNGNPNILSQPEFLPRKKINYGEIFGTPSPKKSTKGKVSVSSAKSRDNNQPHITHRRFLGNDDYRAYICIQYPGKDRKWDSDDEEIKKLNEEPEKVLTCQSCSFKTKRLEVMILHTKMHIQGVYVTSKRKTKKSKAPNAGTDSESDTAVTKSPKSKQRKKKEVTPKTTDVFTNLLEEWDDTDEDMEESIASKKSPKAKKKAVQVEKLPLDNKKEENQNDRDEQNQKNKSAAKDASVTAKNTESVKLLPTKNTQDDIKNCFDFDEEEEDDDFLLPTSVGRKIPRVIPEKPKPSISELLEQSQMEDELEKEKTSEAVDDTEKTLDATENGTDVSKKEILKLSQSFNRETDVDDNIENTFKELMAETELPTLDDLAQNLKPEQNFHDARTVKFPDKGGTAVKGGAASKGGTSKKRFVTSFEDFEAGFRKLEDEEERNKKLGGDKEVKAIQMPNSSRIDDSKEQTPIKPTDEITDSQTGEAVEASSEVIKQVETSPTPAELRENPSKKSHRRRHSTTINKTALNESTEPQSDPISSASVEETIAKQPDTVHSVGKRKTRQSEKEKPIESVLDQTDVKEPNQDATSKEAALDSERKSSRIESVLDQTDVKEPNQDATSQEAALDSKRKSSRIESVLDQTDVKEPNQDATSQEAALDSKRKSSRIESVLDQTDVKEPNQDATSKETALDSKRKSSRIESVLDQTDVKEPNQDATSQEAALDSKRKSSRRRTKQFVIEEDSEEIIEITQECGSNVMDSSEEVVHLDETAKKELAAIDFEIENLKRSLELPPSVPEEDGVCHRTEKLDESLTKSTAKVDISNAVESIETENCNISEEVFESTEQTEVVLGHLEVPKKSQRKTRHSLGIENLQKADEKAKELNEPAVSVVELPSKGKRKVSQKTHLKEESPSGLVEDLPSQVSLDIPNTETKLTLEKSDSANIEPEEPTLKGRKGRSRENQKDEESDLRRKEVSKSSHLYEDKTESKTLETLERSTDFAQLDEPTSKDKGEVGSHHREKSLASDLTEVTSHQNIEHQQEPKATDTRGELAGQQSLEQPVESHEAVQETFEPEPTPRSKKGKTRRHTKEAQQEKCTPPEENSTTDLKVAEAIVTSSDLSTQKSEELDSLKSPTTVLELPNSSSPTKVLEPPTPKTRRGRSQTYAREEEILATGKEAADTVTKLEVPQPEQDLTDIAEIELVAQPAASVTEVHEKLTSKTKKGRQRMSSKETEQHGKVIEEHASKNLESKPAEQAPTTSDITLKSSYEIAEELTPKTRRSRIRKDTKEREQDKSTLQEDEHKDVMSVTEPATAELISATEQPSEKLISVTEQPTEKLISAIEQPTEKLILVTEEPTVKLAKTEIVAVGEEQTASDLRDNIKGMVKLEPEATKVSSTDAAVREGVNPVADSPNTDLVLSKPDKEISEASPRKSDRQTYSKEQAQSAVAKDTPKNSEVEPIEASKEVPQAPLEDTSLELNEEKIVIDFSVPEIAGQVVNSQNVEISIDSVPHMSDKSNLKGRRGRSKKLIKEHEIMESEPQEDGINFAVSESIGQPAESHTEVLKTTVSESVDKIIDHPTPKSRKSRSRKHIKGEESTSLEKNATRAMQTKQVKENNKLQRTVDVPFFSMPEEQFSKTRRGRSRKLTKEEEDFARAIEESLKDMALERNKAEAAIGETQDLSKSNNSIADPVLLDTCNQNPEVSSRKSKKGKSRKNSKSQEHVSAIENEIASKDVVLDGNQTELSKDVVIDSSQSEKASANLAVQEIAVHTVEMENTYIKQLNDHAIYVDKKPSKGKRRFSQRSHLKEEPPSGTDIANAETQHILENSDSAAIETLEPTLKGRKGRSRAHQKDVESELLHNEPTSKEIEGGSHHESFATVLNQSTHEISEQLTSTTKSGRTRKHAKEEQQNITALSEAPQIIEVSPKQIDEATPELFISDTAQTLKPTICDSSVEMSEPPTPKLKRGRPRKHPVQEEILVANPMEETSKIANEKQSKELTAALEFTKTVLELVENQQTVLKTEVAVETAIQKDSEQKDTPMEIISPETHVEISDEHALKTRRGRSRKYTENEEVVKEEISKTEHASNELTMTDSVEHCSLINEDIRLEGKKTTDNLSVAEVVGQSSQNTLVELALSNFGKMPEEALPKSKRGRPRKHIVDKNTENIIKESKSLNFVEPEPAVIVAQPESQAVSLDAHMTDDKLAAHMTGKKSCVVKEYSGGDMGSMGSIIQNAIDQSVATLDSIPKSGLSEWVGELLKNSSSKEEGNPDIGRKEEIPMEAISGNQDHKLSEPTQLEIPGDGLTIQENVSLESNVALVVNIEATKSETTSIENDATIFLTETSHEFVAKNKRRKSKESLKMETTTLETCQVSAAGVQEIVPTCAKSEFVVEQATEGQLGTALQNTIPNQADLASIQAEVDTSTSNKSDHRTIKIHDNREPQPDTALVTKNDRYTAKGRRGRPRKSCETLLAQEDPTDVSVLQSNAKIEEERGGPIFIEGKDADKSDVVDTSSCHELDEQIDNDGKPSIFNENEETVPETVIQISTITEKLIKDTTPEYQEAQTKTLLQPAAVPDVVNRVLLESVHLKGSKTTSTSDKNRSEIIVPCKAAVSSCVKDVGSSQCNKGYVDTSKSNKSWSKKHIEEPEVDESSQVAFKEVLKQKFKDIVSTDADKDSDVTRSAEEQGSKDSGTIKNNAEHIPVDEADLSKNDEIKDISNEVAKVERHRKFPSDEGAVIGQEDQIKLLVKTDSIEHSVKQQLEETVCEETESKQGKLRRPSSTQESTSLVAPDKMSTINKVTEQKTFEEKNRHVPPKKSRWSRRESYTKNDDTGNLLKEQIIDSVPEALVSEEVVIEEQIVEINNDIVAAETDSIGNELARLTDGSEEKNLPSNTDLVGTNHAENVSRILEHSLVDLNDSEIILPPKKSKRASDVKYNFLNDSFAGNTFSLEKKGDSDILSFPSCDDSFMSTSLRNNIEGLIKDIDSFDNSNVSDNLNIKRKDDDEKVTSLDVSATDTIKSNVNLFSSTNSTEYIKEPSDIPKCVPPKKKIIEYSKQDITTSSINSLLSNDTLKSEEKFDVIPQPPKKKIQKLFESNQALEKVGKVSDIPQMSPLAKKKSFLFHPEEFAQKVAEISQQLDIAAVKEPEKKIDALHSTNFKAGEESISILDSKEVDADVNKGSTIPKKRQKRKSSSHGDHLQKKERRTSSETLDANAEQEGKIVFDIGTEPIASQSQDQKQVSDTANTVVDISAPGTPLDDKSKTIEEHKNEMEVKLEEDDFKFCIQTNLTNIATSTAEELSAIAIATLSEIKNEVAVESTSQMVSETLEENKEVKHTVASIKEEDNVESAVKKEETVSSIIPGGIEVSSESEFVPISINPTVMSEKDLADAQVEITTDKVISEKKPTNLAMFSMDFLESSRPNKIHTIKIKKTELILPKANTVGTEFTSKAMTKEFDNRALIAQPKAYALKSELLDILEGNSNSSTNSSGSDQKFKTSFDNYDKQTVVQGMFDFEEAIPSQIVLSNKVDPETVLMDSPKLLERLSMSNEAAKAQSKKVLIQSDIKVSEGVPKGLITKITKPMGTPKPGQKIIIKTGKAQPLSMSKATGNKPIILSEQIIRPANALKPVMAPIQPQGIKRQYEDIEDVETAFIIPKIAKKFVEEEVIPEVVPEKPVRGRNSKTSGKAKILQQTIITPKGEIVQSQTPATTQTAKPGLIQTSQSDDTVFDINSMPIVLSDDLLTPESIQNMPVVLSEDVISQSKPVTVKAEEKVVPTLAKKVVSNVPPKQQIVFKTTLSGPTMPLQAKQMTKPRILSSTPTSTNKLPKPATALLATGTSADGKPTKYVLVPSTVTPTVPQVKTVKPPVIKKQSPVPSKVLNIQSGETPSPIIGNKIMIVTNQHGQQTRVVLTPQQQKAFMHSQPGSKTKAIIKGAIPKALLESASAGPSGIVQKASLPGVPQGVIPTVSSQGGLLMTVGKGAKPPVHPKKTTHRTPAKPQKTILIKNQMGQTVRKIQGTDDADLDRQVAEQLEAIKASARLLQANKTPEIINYTNRHIASSTTAVNTTKTAVRRSYSKKVDPVKVKPIVSTQVQSQKSQEPLIPALTPLSPQPSAPQVQSQTSPNLQKQSPVKLDHTPSSPVNKGADSRLQQQPTVSPKSENKPSAAAPVGAENKPSDRPLTQLVIQDGLGNQTTITEGQILAIPSETVDGQPQSYMLVTLDEMGNITPLNNEALMSLDPSLGLGGDLNNMVLQVDQGQGTVAALKPIEPSVPLVSNEQNKIAERLHSQSASEPKPAPVEQTKPQEVPLSVEQQIVIGEGVLPGADAGGQQLIVTGDPIATQKFLESLSDGSTDLANILANAEGGSVLIQADGQQILIKTNTGGQPLLGISENTEGGGNPIFGSHKPNQDILAAALANTDVFQSSDPPVVHSSPVKGMQSSQLSPSGGSGVLYPMHGGNVLETSLTLNSPIMTPLEVPSLPNKKIDDGVDILAQVPKNVDLPITITDPNISQTVAQQQAIGLMELTLPISETTGSGDINSPSYSYSLPALDEPVGHAQKPFNGSMPLLTEDVTEVESTSSSQIGKIRVARGLQSSETSFSSSYGSLPMLPETIESSREEVVKTSCFGEIESLPMLTEDVIDDSGSSRGSSKPPRSSPKNIERDIVDEGLSTLGGEMCSSLSEPPPDMFDLASITAKEEEISSDMSSIPEPEGETLSLHSENSGEIPIQPQIVANLNDLKRPGDDTHEQDEKRQKFD